MLMVPGLRFMFQQIFHADDEILQAGWIFRIGAFMFFLDRFQARSRVEVLQDQSIKIEETSTGDDGQAQRRRHGHPGEIPAEGPHVPGVAKADADDRELKHDVSQPIFLHLADHPLPLVLQTPGNHCCDIKNLSVGVGLPETRRQSFTGDVRELFLEVGRQAKEGGQIASLDLFPAPGPFTDIVHQLAKLGFTEEASSIFHASTLQVLGGMTVRSPLYLKSQGKLQDRPERYENPEKGNHPFENHDAKPAISGHAKLAMAKSSVAQTESVTEYQLAWYQRLYVMAFGPYSLIRSAYSVPRAELVAAMYGSPLKWIRRRTCRPL